VQQADPVSNGRDPGAAAAAATAGGDPGASAATGQPRSGYTVSVRSLCDFTAKHGDLDRRFTPSATALEGQLGQAAVQARRGPGYECEVPLQGRFGPLLVCGRADGYDPPGNRLEEIKTIRGQPEAMAENRRHLHWAQMQTYGALLCAARGLHEVQLALVYVDAGTQHETVLQQLCSAQELQATLTRRCALFIDWARQELAHRQARDRALQALPFPPGPFRPGQRELAEAVYRTAVNGRCLLAQAPTGIGKTLGALFPMLRAMPGQRLDKIGYLTCKGTGRITALQALQQVREQTPAGAVRVLALVAKEQACEHPAKACHGDACPLARGFYDRLPAAREQAVTEAWMDPAAQRRIALQHGICPYYLGQELLRWADVVVGDVHHAFDPSGQLHGLAQALGWRIGLLVDEAHNLVERTRQMYSAAIGLAPMRAARLLAPAALRPLFGRLIQLLGDAAQAQDADYAAHDEMPDDIAEALQELVSGLGEHLQTQPLAHGPLLDFYFDVVRLQKAADRFGAHSLLDIERKAAGPAWARAGTALGEGGDAVATAGTGATMTLFGPPPTADPDPGDATLGAAIDATLSLRNIAPATFLRPRFEACHCAVLFSATLAPQGYQRDLLGLPDNTGWIDVPPYFAPENLRVRIADRVSTRYPHRGASLAAVVDLMARQFKAHPGNYLAFFSSFQYLQQAADALALRHPQLPQWRQARAMDDAARAAFLARFVPQGQGLAFAVLGGAFAEGVDLPGSRLLGAFIATLGLPPVSPLQDQFRQRLDRLFGAGHGYADLVPGMHKVVQAAGRVLRAPEDRGFLWLMDQRYRKPEVLALLPAWWRHGERQA
jgi:Rad3-related DNA helicase